MTRDLTHDVEYPDSQSESLNSEAMRQWAEDHDMVIYYPKPDEILIDIDDEESMARFHRSFAVLGGQPHTFTILEWRSVNSKTNDGIHKHIIATFNRDLTDLERLLLQACFGSDRTRELLGFLRLLENDPHPTMLAFPKEATVA